MGEAVLDKADCAGAGSSARRPQQGHQHLDRRPLARPVPVRQPGQVTSSDAATRVPHRDRLGRAHHARGARRDERRRGHNKPVGQGGEPVSDSETASQQRVPGSRD